MNRRILILRISYHGQMMLFHLIWLVRPLPLMWKVEATSWIGLAPHCSSFADFIETREWIRTL